MAKREVENKQQNFQEELAALKKEFSIDNKKEDIFISSGSLALDLALGGKGWKCGRQAELKAWEGSGKTTICLSTVREAQRQGFKYAYIDAEHSLNKEYAEAVGIDWEKFEDSLFQPQSGEQAFEYAKRLIKTGECRLIIFDSTSGMLPLKQMEDEAGSSNLGLHARLFSAQVPIVKALADKHNTLVIYISQIREKIGVMFGSPETTQAGNALKFFDDYRIDLKKTIESENGKDEDATGIRTGFHITKNKVYKPYIKGEFHIIKGEGIDSIRELLDLGKEIGIIKIWGKTLTYPNIEEGTKYELEEFPQILKDNPELLKEIKNKILENIK